jgi:flagellar FliL protein
MAQAQKKDQTKAQKPPETPTGTQLEQSVASNDATEAVAEDGSAKGGRRRSLIVGFAAVVVVGLGIGGAWYFMRAAPDDAAADGSAAPAHAIAIYQDLRPEFIVNSLAVGQHRYLQTDITIMARDPAVIEAVNVHAPVIRSALVNILADQDFLLLQSDAAKQSLREKMRAAVDATVQKEAGVTGVEAVLFTSFVMQ